MAAVAKIDLKSPRIWVPALVFLVAAGVRLWSLSYPPGLYWDEQYYVFDAEVSAFMRQSNPWALRGIAERLLEAADRGLWAEPPPDTLDQLRATYLELEGQLEGDGE